MEETKNQLSDVSLVWATHNGDQLIEDMARVSNLNPTQPSKNLIAYLIKHKHWSPFEMCNMCVEIYTPRDISRQLLRHRFGFQEFSQRYASVQGLPNVPRELRRQDLSNRQKSLEWLDMDTYNDFQERIDALMANVTRLYDDMLDAGVAKETARVILPEGLTISRLFVNGTVRQWIHYLQVRMDADTVQAEHVWLANQINDVFKSAYPKVHSAVFGE